MATIATQNKVKNGGLEDVTFVGVAASDTFNNDGKSEVWVMNENVATRTIAVSPGGTGFQGVGDGSIALLASVNLTIPAISGATPGMTQIGPLDRDIFGTAPTIVASATGDVSIAVLRNP